jgi:hypothetical protein
MKIHFIVNEKKKKKTFAVKMECDRCYKALKPLREERKVFDDRRA